MDKRASVEDSRYGPGAKKPAGGFCFIPGRALIAAWWAYRGGFIRLLDLRVWLACFEAVERRCCVSRGRQTRFELAEIHQLVGGVGGEHVRKAVRRLERVGLLQWSTSGPDLRGCEASLPAAVQVEVEHSVSRAFGCQRRVPVPRRILRLLAAEGSRAVIATAFGHLLRCSFYRGGLCFSRGTCKASWVAELFRVDVRNVKRGRRYLVDLGWLLPKAVRQKTLNRHGAVVALNLAWSGAWAAARRAAEPELPPQRPRSTTDLPPPYKNKQLLRKIQQPEPAERGRTGVHTLNGPGEPRREKRPTPSEQSTNIAKPPALRHVLSTDLEDSRRLAILYEKALSAGLLTRCEANRLNFFAAAEHARSVGLRNPCGLFMTLIRRRLWAFITQADEEAARRRLRAFDAATAPPVRVGLDKSMWAAVPSEAATSERAAVRALIQRSLAEADNACEAA